MRSWPWLALWALCSVSTSVHGQQARLSWDKNTEADLRGYKIYYGIASRDYAEIEDVGFANRAQEDGRREWVVDITYDQRWFFAVTAYDTARNESDFSNEVSVTYSNVPQDPDPLLAPVITEVAIATNGLSFIITWKSTSTNVDKFQVLWSDTPDRMRWRKTVNESEASSSGQYYAKLIYSNEEMIEGNRYYFVVTAVRGQEISGFSDIVEKIFEATEPPVLEEQYEIWAPLQMIVGDSGKIILKFRKKKN